MICDCSKVFERGHPSCSSVGAAGGLLTHSSTSGLLSTTILPEELCRVCSVTEAVVGRFATTEPAWPQGGTTALALSLSAAESESALSIVPASEATGGEQVFVSSVRSERRGEEVPRASDDDEDEDADDSHDLDFLRRPSLRRSLHLREGFLPLQPSSVADDTEEEEEPDDAERDNRRLRRGPSEDVDEDDRENRGDDDMQ
ncbi:hypothetical protein C0Q70_00494 [Pomacea canaliculata]|uniref:Uncharacterized protein n=1 Tax=Pomacea canaliculata TaxID=400727 RepID=A0A2T7PWU5_POMCA|nr:hypothetical protein C0Q70_00494 [Pomacea canaliculata]